jgi:hypothetical protein
MVTGTHEAHHSIFRHDDDLFPEVMEQVFGLVLGKAARVTCLSTDLTERQPLERRVDSVLLAELLVEDKGSKYIVVVEAQTDPDDKKWWSWPYYIAYLRARYECPVILLVVCTKPATEQWARAEITSGLGELICMRVTPAVAGPGNVEPVTDLDKARANVGFAAFSALTHSRMGSGREILEVLAEALGGACRGWPGRDEQFRDLEGPDDHQRLPARLPVARPGHRAGLGEDADRGHSADPCATQCQCARV